MAINEPTRAENMPPIQQYFGKADHVEITVSDTGDKQTLKALIDGHEYNRLDKLLRSVANRCNRSIRNRGNAPHFHELPEDGTQDAEKRLYHLGVEFIDDSGNWKPLITPPKGEALFWSLLSGSQFDTTTNLNVSAWPDIDEAIQDNLPPAPEDEFTHTGKKTAARVGPPFVSCISPLARYLTVMTTSQLSQDTDLMRRCIILRLSLKYCQKKS
jgi:hypothetical protein